MVDTSISPDGNTAFTERVYDVSDGRLIWFDKPLPSLLRRDVYEDGIAIAGSLEGGEVFGVRVYDVLTGKNPGHTSASAKESQTKMNRHTRLCHRAIGVRSRAARSMTILQRPLPCGPMTSKTENWAGHTIFTEWHRSSVNSIYASASVVYTVDSVRRGCLRSCGIRHYERQEALGGSV